MCVADVVDARGCVDAWCREITLRAGGARSRSVMWMMDGILEPASQSPVAGMVPRGDLADTNDMCYMRCVDELLSHGANTSLTNDEGLTALGVYRSKCRSNLK